MAAKVPQAQEPRLAAEIGVQEINVSTEQDDGRNKEPAREKKPERQPPGKILKRKPSAQRQDDYVTLTDGGAKF